MTLTAIERATAAAAAYEDPAAAVNDLLRTAEQAHALARELHEGLRRLRSIASDGQSNYSLGICEGDAWTSANRLGGLRSELADLERTLRANRAA